MKVGDIVRVPSSKRGISQWALGVLVEIEEIQYVALLQGGHPKVYHVLEDNGDHSKHDFVVAVSNGAAKRASV
jgi:hypothetical protein